MKIPAGGAEAKKRVFIQESASSPVKAQVTQWASSEMLVACITAGVWRVWSSGNISVLWEKEKTGGEQ